MKKIFTSIAVCACLIMVAQTPNYNSTDKRLNATRNSFWYEANIQGTLARYKDSAAKWQYQVDLQYRRMADANYIKDGNRYNIFADPFQHVYRPWIHYWIKPKAIRLSLSPIGYWATWTPRNEGKQLFYGEYRICPQVTFFQKIGKLEIQQRYRFEFRIISNKDTARANGGTTDYGRAMNYQENGQKMRLRYMVRFNYPLNGKSTGTKGSTYLSVWNEAFIGMGANTVDTKMFDQDRVVVLLGRYLKCKYPIKVEVGYTWQYAPKYDIAIAPGQVKGGAYDYGKLNWEANNALQVYLICDDFHKFGFKKKKEEVPVAPVTP
ncbi:MAG: DUF2490 domain-containing protein [Bacteroidia bacterium]